MKKSKYYLLLISMFMFFEPNINIMAAPLSNVPVTLDQPNGTKYKCFATGDEYYRRLHDAEGSTIVYNDKTGWFVYADLKDGIFVPTNLKPGKDLPSVKQGLVENTNYIRSKVEKQKGFISFKTLPVKSKSYNKILSAKKDTLNNIVIFIKFADDSDFVQSYTYYDDLFNKPNSNSMKAYFSEASYNQLTVNSHFYPKTSNTKVLCYKDYNSRNYYKEYTESNQLGFRDYTYKLEREHTLIKDALESVKSQISSNLNVDYDNDGKADNVCFIISGSPDGLGSLLWTHSSSLYTYNVQINNKRVWKYNFQFENSIDMNGNGVLCHEMSHSLGLADLYHYNQDGFTPVGMWDLMGANATIPQNISAYMKYKYLDWISEIPVISHSGTYSINKLTMPENNCWRINSNNPDEYYVIEFRKRESMFEYNTPASGLVIYRINTQYDGKGNNFGPFDEIYVYRQDGTLENDGSIVDASFSYENGRTSFNSSTNPSPFLSDGTDGGLNIDQISSALGNSMTFRVRFGDENTYTTLASPADDSTVYELNPLFRWNLYNNAQSYHLMVSSKSDFLDSNIINQENIADNYFTSQTDLAQLSKYFWKVRAKLNDNTYSDWSPANAFTTSYGLSIDSIVRIDSVYSHFTYYYRVYLHPGIEFNQGNYFTLQLSDSIGNYEKINFTTIHHSTKSESFIFTPNKYIKLDNYKKFRVTSSIPNIASQIYNKSIEFKNLVNVELGSSTGNKSCGQRFTAEEIGENILNKWSFYSARIIGDSTLPWVYIKYINSQIYVMLSQKYIGDISYNDFGISYSGYVLPKPVFFPYEKAVCAGKIVTYYTKDNKNIKKEWSVSGGEIIEIIDQNSIKVQWGNQGKGKICLKEIFADECPDSTELIVDICNEPHVQFDIPDKICRYEESVLHAFKMSGLKYKWIVEGAEVIGTDNADSIRVKWTSNDNAKVTLTTLISSGGCSASLEKIIYIRTLPQLKIYGPNSLCYIEESTFWTEKYNDLNYEWSCIGSKGINVNKTKDTIRVKWAAGGKYIIKLSYSNINGCSAVETLNYEIYYKPKKPLLLYLGGKLTTDMNSAAHKWYFNDIEIPGETFHRLVPTKTGIYTAAINNNGCLSNKSDEYYYTVQSVFDASNGLILLSPNPANTVLNVSVSKTEIVNKIEILDIKGDLILTIENDLDKNEFTVNTNDFANGMYILKVYTPNGIKAAKFTVLK